MQGNRAKITASVAAAMGGNGEADRIHCSHRTVLCAGWVHGAFIGQTVDVIQFLRCQGRLRGVVDKIALCVPLNKTLPGYVLAAAGKKFEHVFECMVIVLNFFK